MVNRCFDRMVTQGFKVAAVAPLVTLASAAHAQPSPRRMVMAAIGPDDVWRFLAQALGDSLPLIVVIFLALLVLVTVGFLIALAATMRAHRRIAAAEKFLATAFRLEGLRLEAVPEQFRELDRRTADLMRDYQELQRAPKIQTRTAGSSFVSILTQIHGQAVTEAEKLADNALFKQVDGVLEIQGALVQFESHCAQLGRETNLPRAMLTALESKDTWNAMLTIPNILETYFDNDAFRPLVLRLRAIEYVLRAVFLNLDVDILVFRPLSSTDAVATRTKDAPRNLASLPGVRQRAAEGARVVADRGAIVMDCFAPGWNSNKIGRRPPQFTIYEPNS